MELCHRRLTTTCWTQMTAYQPSETWERERKKKSALVSSTEGACQLASLNKTGGIHRCSMALDWSEEKGGSGGCEIKLHAEDVTISRTEGFDTLTPAFGVEMSCQCRLWKPVNTTGLRRGVLVLCYLFLIIEQWNKWNKCSLIIKPILRTTPCF